MVMTLLWVSHSQCVLSRVLVVGRTGGVGADSAQEDPVASVLTRSERLVLDCLRLFCTSPERQPFVLRGVVGAVHGPVPVSSLCLEAHSQSLVQPAAADFLYRHLARDGVALVDRCRRRLQRDFDRCRVRVLDFHVGRFVRAQLCAGRLRQDSLETLSRFVVFLVVERAHSHRAPGLVRREADGALARFEVLVVVTCRRAAGRRKTHLDACRHAVARLLDPANDRDADRASLGHGPLGVRRFRIRARRQAFDLELGVHVPDCDFDEVGVEVDPHRLLDREVQELPVLVHARVRQHLDAQSRRGFPGEVQGSGSVLVVSAVAARWAVSLPGALVLLPERVSDGRSARPRLLQRHLDVRGLAFVDLRGRAEGHERLRVGYGVHRGCCFYRDLYVRGCRRSIVVGDGHRQGVRGLVFGGGGEPVRLAGCGRVFEPPLSAPTVRFDRAVGILCRGRQTDFPATLASALGGNDGNSRPSVDGDRYGHARACCRASVVGDLDRQHIVRRFGRLGCRPFSHCS